MIKTILDNEKTNQKSPVFRLSLFPILSTKRRAEKNLPVYTKKRNSEISNLIPSIIFSCLPFLFALA